MHRAIPLRVQLTAVLLVLFTGAVATIGAVSIWTLHTSLLQRVDRQIDLTLAKPVIAPGDTLVLIRERDGRYRSPIPISRQVDHLPWPAIPNTTNGQSRTVSAEHGSNQWRIKVLDNGRERLAVAVDLQDTHETVRRLTWIVVLASGGILAIFAVLAVTAIRRNLSALEVIGDTADAIAAGKLDQRVPHSDRHTEVGRIAGALNGMLTQIESAVHARAASEAQMRRFTADASHELRSPLTAIRGFAELGIENPELDPVVMLRRVDAAAEKMTWLVDDLLLLARLDQRPDLQFGSVDLLTVVADAVQETRLLSPAREIRFKFGTDALIVVGDESRLRQVVGNLLANARLHTPEDSAVTVRAGMSTDAVFVEVADEGPGLTAEQLRHVFDRFYRADPARPRAPKRYQGTGLGLAIVHALVKAHGGHITVHSALGVGTTFRVTLPTRIDKLDLSALETADGPDFIRSTPQPSAPAS